MTLGIGTARRRAVLSVAALVATIALGFLLRLVDPLSSPVIPGEDPYTHMAIVRENLRTGDLSPPSFGSNLYPPGLHSFIAAAWVFTGADLYEIIRIGPAVLGAIGILGMALLLWRHAGPIAAIVGSLGMAVAPELIFRTTMMSPTAQDLALLPFFFLALLEVMEGRIAWVGVAAPIALFLVFAHPWLFAILAVTGAVFIALAYFLPYKAFGQASLSPRGLAAALAIVGGGLGLTLTSCGGACGPGWVDIVPGLAGHAWLAWILAALCLAPLAVLSVAGRRATGLSFALPRDRPFPVWARITTSAIIVGLVGTATGAAARQGMPPYVDLPRMIGWPILLLASLAIVLLPFLPGRLVHLAAGLFAATYPFVIFNPLNSPFWSHRTVAFLAVTLTLLAGLVASALARWAAQAIAAHGGASPTPRGAAARRFAAMAAAFLVSIACVGSVYAGTPDGYPGGWYRLYSSCELEGLKEVAAAADAAPAAVVVVGGWEAKLVLSALAEGAYRIWYDPTMYTDPERRDDVTATFAHEGRPLVVIVDRYVQAADPGSTAFLDESGWEPVGSWCAGQGTGEPRLVAYQGKVPA